MSLYQRFYNWLTFKENQNGLTAEQWVDWQRDFKKQAPIRYWLVYTVKRKWILKLSIKRSLFVEKIEFRTINKYHVVVTKLKPNFYNKPTRMFHACFSLLVDYVQQTGIDQLESWYNDNERYREVVDLYHWYQQRDMREKLFKQYPYSRNDFEDECILYTFSKQFEQEHPELHQQRERVYAFNKALYERFDQEDNQRLMQLIQLRELLV